MLISRDSQLTPKRAEALLDEHPQMLECASPSTALKRLASPSIWCAATFIMRAADAAESDAFLAGVASGIGLFPGDPRLAVRRRLELAKGATGVSLDPSAQAWLVLRAWMAFVARRQLRSMPLPATTNSRVAWEKLVHPNDKLYCALAEAAG